MTTFIPAVPLDAALTAPDHDRPQWMDIEHIPEDWHLPHEFASREDAALIEEEVRDAR
jgi:hypothetical protein